MQQQLNTFLDDNKLFPAEIIFAGDSSMKLSIEVDLSRTSRQLFCQHLSDGLMVVIDEKSQQFCLSSENILTSTLEIDSIKPLITISFHGEPLVEIVQNTNGELVEHNANINHLCSSECKMLGRYEHKNTLPYSRQKLKELPQDFHLKTDLHTHLSSQISSMGLLDAAAKAGIAYPVGLLERLGVSVTSDMDRTQTKAYQFSPATHENHDFEQQGEIVSAIKISDILQDDEMAKKLQDLMALPVDNIASFEEVEYGMYRSRNPLNKNEKLVNHIITQVAKEYAEQGVKYAELSVTGAFDSKWLKAAIIAMADAEEKTGVQLRLLPSMFRDDAPHKMLNKLEQVKFLSQNPYIVGVDFIGYEANKTKNFAWALENISKWAKDQKQGVDSAENGWKFADDFVVRVHAGENGKNKGNVKEALDIAAKHGVRMRIGHAAHGEVSETAKNINKDLTILEFNPDSNIALNNIDMLQDIPMKEWLDSDTPAVIASDGAGAYLTDTKQLIKAAIHAGLNANDLAKINQTEIAYINHQQELFEAKKQAFENKYSSLDEFMTAFNAKFDMAEHEVEGFTKSMEGRTPILLAGASGSSWKLMSKFQRRNAENVINMMVDSLNPMQVYFVQGRVKDAGLGKVLDEAIERHNNAEPNPSQRFHVLGMMSTLDKAPKLSRHIDHIITFDKRFEQMGHEMIPFIAKQNGMAIFIGGSQFTRELINLAEDHLQGRYLLMADAQGASAEKARLSDVSCVFDDVEDLKLRLEMRLNDN